MGQKRKRRTTKASPPRARKRTVGEEQATLEAGATFEAPPATTTRRVVCYNPRCPDYKRERNYDEACQCKRTTA